MEKKTFDIEGLDRYLRDMREFQLEEKVKKEREARNYFEGYEKAINDVQRILNSSNYEIKEDSKPELEKVNEKS